MFDLALVTCRRLPEPDFDQAPLVEALARAGIRSCTAAWDDPAHDWSSARLTLLRSTWNYPLDPDGFLAWAERVAQVSELCNPLPLVRWNVHKGYLLALELSGVPTVPTELVAQGAGRTLREIRWQRGWSELVVKPAISAASYRTLRVTPGEERAGEEHLRELTASGDALVQPYLRSVEGYGERALVWIDGELTHGVRKSRRLAGDPESVAPATRVSSAERRLAARAVAAAGRAVGEEPLYARVDAAPGPDGEPVVMELELIEPSLFFPYSAQALDRFVGAIRRRLGTA